MFFGQESFKTSRYFLLKKIFLIANESQFKGNSEVEEYIL